MTRSLAKIDVDLHGGRKRDAMAALIAVAVVTAAGVAEAKNIRQATVLTCPISLAYEQCAITTATKVEPLDGELGPACEVFAKRIETQDQVERLVMAKLHEPPIPMADYVRVICINFAAPEK